MSPTEPESTMTDATHIDGSAGEGGGQILRTSLALSLVTGRPIVVENIRAGRSNPGLMRQHLTAVNAAAQVGAADVRGGQIGSKSLSFTPGEVGPGDYHFSVGTAGSATLVLQTILPALLIAGGPSRLTLEGGTHNPWAPPFDFLERAYLPLVNRMGPTVTAALERPGFYPAGGGRFTVSVNPAPRLNGFDLLERGEVRRRTVTAVVANLPLHIASREVSTALGLFNWDDDCGRTEERTANGPGNVIFTTLEYEHVTEVFSAFGRVGASAEHVAREVVRETRDYLKTNVPVGTHLADQLMLPLAIAAWQHRHESSPRLSTFRTSPLSRHAVTQAELLRTFLSVRIDVTDDDAGAKRVAIGM